MYLSCFQYDISFGDDRGGGVITDATCEEI